MKDTIYERIPLRIPLTVDKLLKMSMINWDDPRILRWWREPEEYHRPATSLYPYSKPGRRVDKRVFYHCAVQTSKCYVNTCTCTCGRIIIYDTTHLMNRSDVIYCSTKV